MKIITLNTDFGLEDNFVGVMKGVILSINPNVRIVDINNYIPPQNILAADYSLNNSYKFFPKGTIHLVVVDPGVGSERSSILVATENYFFIGPDNGVFTSIYESNNSYQVYSLENRKYSLEHISSTFHGRDIFAPVAAHLSLGIKPEVFGKELHKPFIMQIPKPKVNTGIILGEIIYVDRFGNLISNITSNLLNNNDKIVINSEHIGSLSKSYSDVEIGELVILKGSSGYIEVAINQGSALKFFGKKNIGIKIEKN